VTFSSRPRNRARPRLDQPSISVSSLVGKFFSDRGVRSPNLWFIASLAISVCNSGEGVAYGLLVINVAVGCGSKHPTAQS
jgi:hypothetical protein